MAERTSIPEMVHDMTELIRIGWNRGHLAVDHEGKSCAPESDQACEWCEHGAVLAITRARLMDDKVVNYIMDLINMANPGKQYNEYKKGEGDFTVTYKYNDTIRTQHEEAIARFENTEQFLKDNPQFATTPKYQIRTFAYDD